MLTAAKTLRNISFFTHDWKVPSNTTQEMYLMFLSLSNNKVWRHFYNNYPQCECLNKSCKTNNKYFNPIDRKKCCMENPYDTWHVLWMTGLCLIRHGGWSWVFLWYLLTVRLGDIVFVLTEFYKDSSLVRRAATQLGYVSACVSVT